MSLNEKRGSQGRMLFTRGTLTIHALPALMFHPLPYFYKDTTLVATLIALVVCTRSAGEYASKHRQVAQWFWVPFTVILFVLQVRHSSGRTITAFYDDFRHL